MSKKWKITFESKKRPSKRVPIKKTKNVPPPNSKSICCIFTKGVSFCQTKWAKWKWWGLIHTLADLWVACVDLIYSGNIVIWLLRVSFHHRAPCTRRQKFHFHRNISSRVDHPPVHSMGRMKRMSKRTEEQWWIWGGKCGCCLPNHLNYFQDEFPLLQPVTSGPIDLSK